MSSTSADEVSEVMVISDSKKHNVNCSIYELTTGQIMHTQMNGHSVPKGLSFITDDYLISALSEKPELKVWTVSNSHDEVNTMSCPGKVSCLAVSYCGNFCVAGIDKSVYVWEVMTGKLLNILEYHSQAVSCLKFTSDASYLISGGKDGMVFVWVMSAIINMSDTYESETPHFSWLDHSAEVTDIFVGKLGIFSRVVTTSPDMTCKIYELETGSLLTTICTDYEITAVVMDECEYFLLLGSNDGNIYRINLFASRGGEVQHSSSKSKYAFIGHTKPITCLSLSSMGKYLLSGSEDCFCRLWDMSNFVCVRKLTFDGPITNAFITLFPPCLKVDNKSYPPLHVSTFSKAFGGDKEDSLLTTRVPHQELSLFHIESPDHYFDALFLKPSSEKIETACKTKVSLQELESINYQLFSYAVCDLVQTKSQPSENE